jgi:hypothetical protein
MTFSPRIPLVPWEGHAFGLPVHSSQIPSDAHGVGVPGSSRGKNGFSPLPRKPYAAMHSVP